MFGFANVKNFLGAEYAEDTRKFFDLTKQDWFIQQFEELFSTNSEWATRSANEQVFFILNYGKYSQNNEYKIQLNFVGINYVPTISITLPNRYPWGY